MKNRLLNTCPIVGLRALRLLAVLAIASVCAFGSVTITVNGTYDASAPTNNYSQPNATWSLSFEVDDHPSTSATTPTEFRTNFTNAVFRLNGTPVPVTGSSVTFADTSLNVYLDAPVNTQFIIMAPQMFTASTSSPTMVPGTYHATQIYSATTNPSGGFFFGYNNGGSDVTMTSSAAATPLPPTAALVPAGLAGLAMMRKYWRKAR